MTLIWSHSTGRDLVQRRCLTKSFQTRLLAMLMILHIRTYSVYMNVCGCIYTAFWRQLPLVLWLPLKAMTEEWIEPFIFVRQWWEWRMLLPKLHITSFANPCECLHHITSRSMKSDILQLVTHKSYYLYWKCKWPAVNRFQLKLNPPPSAAKCFFLVLKREATKRNIMYNS